MNDISNPQMVAWLPDWDNSHLEYTHHVCDVCGADDPAEIEVARHYMTGPLHVCKSCGHVYIIERRTGAAIAEAWSELYRGAYNAILPHVRAQHTYIGHILDAASPLKDKLVLDVGAGEGHMGRYLDREFGCVTWHVEPSGENCFRNPSANVFQGTLEEFNPGAELFDVAIFNFTLENCGNPREVLEKTYSLLRPGGMIIVVTGHRVLAPINRSLGAYLSKTPPDTHPTRWSASCLRSMLNSVKLPVQEGATHNPDVGLMYAIGYKDGEPDSTGPLDYRMVIKFFDDWHSISPPRPEPPEGPPSGNDDGPA